MELSNVNIENYNYERGQVYWIDLGEDTKGSEQNGFRPCVIVSNDMGNKYSTTLIVAILSSKIHKAKLPTHILLKKAEYKWLKKDSFIAMEQLRTIDKVRVSGYIGSINNDIFNKALEISLGLKNTKCNTRLYKAAEIKINYLKELKTFINMWISKGRSVNLIEEEVEEYVFKLNELYSFLNDNKLASEFDLKDLEINQRVKMVG